VVEIENIASPANKYKSDRISLSSLHFLIYYADFFDSVNESLKTIVNSESPEALIDFAQSIRNETESQSFQNMRKELEGIRDDIKDIKSITVGINLDSNLQVKEAGLVKVNREYYKSGSFLDRLLRLELAPSACHRIREKRDTRSGKKSDDDALRFDIAIPADKRHESKSGYHAEKFGWAAGN
jgi:hypothetical protein